MPHSSYPTVSDLDAFFVSTGLIAASTDTPYTSIDRASKCAAASADFERRTRRTMIAESSTRLFDVPWDRLGVLDVADDLLSVNSITVDGAALIEGQQYWLLPYDAVQKGRPYTHIEMAFVPTPGPLSVYRRTVSVMGMWGYGTEISDDVWTAVLVWAAALCAPELALNISRGLALWHEGDEEERYSGLGISGPLAKEASEWAEMYQATVRSWTRYTSWG